LIKVTSPAEILNWANLNNWLTLYASDGNILCVLLSPGGNVLEFYFDKNKVTIKTLPSFVCK
jgi:hypothetical protein